jgi:hypothetical protein
MGGFLSLIEASELKFPKKESPKHTTIFYKCKKMVVLFEGHKKIQKVRKCLKWVTERGHFENLPQLI